MYASGPKRRFCRKASKRRSEAVRREAADRISKSARAMLKRSRAKATARREAADRISKSARAMLKRSRTKATARREAADRISKSARAMLKRSRAKADLRRKAADRISKSARAMLKRKTAKASAHRPSGTGKGSSLSPMSKHYQKVAARERPQPSIYLFRTRCKLFPHPVEIFSPDGITVPVGHNFAVDLSKPKHCFTLARRLTEFVPSLKPHQKIYDFKDANNKAVSPRDTHVKFPIDLYGPGFVVVGVKLVKSSEEASSSHLVFFEVRIDEDGPHAMVLDPNGPSTRYTDCLKRFFDGIPYKVAKTNDVNRNEKHRLMQSDLSRLGLAPDREKDWLGGYCATIASFYLIDYVCTNQWQRRDLNHFVRASREWLFAPEENEIGWCSLSTMTIRVVLFGRYLAYRIMALTDPVLTDDLVRRHKVTFEKVKISVSVLSKPDRILDATISVGTKTQRIRETATRKIEDYDEDLSTKLVF